ncbi:MAG: patatin-like phospholipase family protein [Chloroflexi bacterium]|nr:patatin-like phospholipase family protein [Chloroflexota bacterium]
MSGISQMILRIFVVVLHIILAGIAVLLAMVWGAIYWLIWLVALPFKGHQEPSKLPDAGDLSAGISIESLLGSSAPKSIDAIFEGGGVKALAQVGAARAVEQLQLSWKLLGGTSGGAIVASLLASGKGSSEIWKLLTEVGLHRFVDVWYLPPVPFLQKRLYFYLPLLAHLMFTKGMVAGRVFLKTMREILQKDEQELRFRGFLNVEREKDPDRPRHRLKMVATDISRGTPIVLPDDLSVYWEAWEQARKLSGKAVDRLTPEDAQDWWSVAEAVRMSMSIPFFFKPVSLHLNVSKDGKTVQKNNMGQKGQQVLIVDGGVSSNFPIWLFDRLDKTPRWPTFGFLLDESKGTPTRRPRVARFLTDLAISVVGTGMGAMDKRLSEHDQYRTARLRTLQVRTTQFGLSPAAQRELVESGFDDAVDFLKRFNWIQYLNRFRR